MTSPSSFSVLISLFVGESGENFDACLSSIAHQTLFPDEVVLVLDGLVSQEHREVIEKWSDILPLNVYPKEHSGLALSLQYGLERCRYDLVVRTDTDDRSLPTRFEKLICTIQNSNFSVVSGDIIEIFPDGRKRIKSVPSGKVGRSSVVSFFRSPLNHNNCVVKRQDVLSVGGYTKGRMEDFRLWIKMLAKGYCFYNISGDALLEASAANIEARRSGSEYIRAEFLVFNESRKRWFGFGLVFASIALALKVPLRFESMSRIRKFCYAYFLRERL